MDERISTPQDDPGLFAGPAAPDALMGELASDPSVVARLNAFESAVNATLASIPEHPEYAHVGYYSFDTSGLQQDLKAGSYSPTLLTRYMETCARFYKETAPLANRKPPLRELAIVLEDTVPAELLQQTFASEDSSGPVHELLLELFKSEFEFDSERPYVDTGVGLLRAACGGRSAIDIMRPSHDPYHDEIRNLVASNASTIGAMYRLDSLTMPTDDEALSETERHRAWMRNFVLAATDIVDPEIADSYIYVASSKDPVSWPDNLARIMTTMDALSPEELQTLREFSQTYTLMDYTVEQLRLMARVARGDEAEIARLKEHDVQVVFRNRMGDSPSGALRDVPKKFDDEHARTLFFDVQSWDDIDIHRQQLKDRGIRPSKVVISMHANAGFAAMYSKPPIGSTTGPFQSASVGTPQYTAHRTATQGMIDGGQRITISETKLADLVRDGMQPSRGIDDHHSTSGMKVVILDACLGGEEGEMHHADPVTGEVFSIGTASLASGLGNEFASQGLSDIMIFAAPASIQTRDSGHFGVYYHHTAETRSIPAKLLQIMPDGTIQPHEVDEIPLRNFESTRPEYFYQLIANRENSGR